MSRKLAREIAFKIVFEYAFQPDEEFEMLKEGLLINDENEKIDINLEDEKYIVEITNGIKDKKTELDNYISQYLKDGWSMDRISKIDIAILKLAIYEILYRDDIPYKVSANEAVELAKSFSDEASPAFINGILAEIINKKLNSNGGNSVETTESDDGR